MNLKDYSIEKVSRICSSFYLIKFYYEYPKTDLLEFSKVDRLNDKELTHILYQQILANEVLERKLLFHGDIRP